MLAIRTTIVAVLKETRKRKKEGEGKEGSEKKINGKKTRGKKKSGEE